jgi:outer membrane protein assembly factor BamD
VTAARAKFPGLLARLAPSLLVLATIASLAGCGAGVLPPIHSETQRLELARQMAAKGNYSDAIELLKTFIANNAGSAEVDHAIYLLGECYSNQKEWASAAIEFERLTRDYPESDSAGSAAFQLGAAMWGQSRPPDFEQENTRRALAQWENYLRDYPGHWLNAEAGHRIQLARMRLATKLLNAGDLYAKLRLIGPARVYYRRVEDEYGDTPQLGDAWVGFAMCDALEKKKDAAIERLKQVESRFAGRPVAARAAHERARLQKK